MFAARDCDLESVAGAHAGQGYQGGRRSNSAGGGQPQQHQVAKPVQQRLGDPRANRYDDGNSALERAGYMRQERAPENPLGYRIGNRELPPCDQRNRLDRLYLSEILEEQGPPGPVCFAPRIMRERAPGHKFELPPSALKIPAVAPVAPNIRCHLLFLSLSL